jgi:hypothetical protein
LQVTPSENSTLPNIDDVEVNDFVLLKMIAQTRKVEVTYYYVGRVLSRTASEVTIQCMRRHNLSLNQFTYPSEDDINVYSGQDLVKRLSLPKIVRGVHHFPCDELALFTKTLR